MNRLIKKVCYEYGAWEFAFYICSSSSIPPASSLVPFTSVVERRRSLDQCGRAGLRVHQQWRNDGGADKPVAMRGEVKLGLVVGLIFLVRFIWVQSTHSGRGRWVGSSIRMPGSKIRRITDWGIYLGVAASVVSGLLIAYLRPGAELIPESRGFTTSSAVLNVAIDAHAFISDALEWLCAFHAVYALWYWRIRGTRWGKTASVWLERIDDVVGGY